MFGYVIIRVCGECEIVSTEEYEFTYDELIKAINCDSICLVSVGSQYYMCVDDDGISAGKDINYKASLLYGGYIYGDVLVGYIGLSYEGMLDIYKMPVTNCLLLKSFLESV